MNLTLKRVDHFWSAIRRSGCDQQNDEKSPKPENTHLLFKEKYNCTVDHLLYWFEFVCIATYSDILVWLHPN